MHHTSITIAHCSHLCDDLMPSILCGWDYNMKYIAIQIQYNCQIISGAIITLLRQTHAISQKYFTTLS